MLPLKAPRGLIFDYGGTLVYEVGYDAVAGMEALLVRAVSPPSAERLDLLRTRLARIAREVAGRRDDLCVETPWPALTRLAYDALGISLSGEWPELELVFWNAAVRTEVRPGIADALAALRAMGLPMGVLSNSSFGAHVIRHELSKHGLARFFDDLLVTADYAVRKPNPLVFDVAAARLGVQPSEAWFIGDRLDIDVAGARAAGMTAVWYAPEPGADAADADADLVLRDWSALPRLIDDLGR